MTIGIIMKPRWEGVGVGGRTFIVYAATREEAQAMFGVGVDPATVKPCTNDEWAPQGVVYGRSGRPL